MKARDERWEKLKSNPIAYKQHLKRHKEYYLKHRKIILKKGELRRKELVKISKEIGNCSLCHKPKQHSQFKTCERCRKKQRDRIKKSMGVKKK